MKYISFKTGICLAIVGLMFILFYYYTPWLLDDYWFAKSYMNHNGGSSSFSFQALYQFAKTTRNFENGRLANVLAPVSTLMISHWLFAVLAGCLCSLLIYLIVRSASVKAHMPLVISGTALASIVCLPWRDSMFVADFFLNYVLSSVLVLTLLLILNRVAKRNILGPVVFVVACILALVSAWLHEGFSVPVCVGLGLYAIIHRFRLTWQWYMIAMFFIMGTLWVITAPGMWVRVENVIGNGDEVNMAKRIIQFTPLLLPLSATFAAICISPRGRRKLHVLFYRTSLAIYAGAAITSAGIAIFMCPWARVAWPAEMFMMIIVLMLGRDVLRQMSGKVARILSVASLLVFVAIMGYALFWQKKFYDENRQIVADMEIGNGTVYRDLLVDSLIRWHVLYLPTYNAYINNFQYSGMSDWYGKTCAVVPAEMAEFDAAELVPVDGTVSKWRSYTIAPPDTDRCASFIIENGEMYLRLNFTDPQGVLRSYLRKI